MAAKPCTQCGVEPKMRHKPYCVECWAARQPAATQVKLRNARLAVVPEEVRRARVPEREWPPGRRWCAGCQSFARIIDCSGSRCKACATAARHAAGIKADFGMTAEEYDTLLRVQGGKCAICLRHPRAKRMAVDHDHSKTGRASWRGLLCSTCNHDLLGAARDDVETLRRAVAYLERPPAQRYLSS